MRGGPSLSSSPLNSSNQSRLSSTWFNRFGIIVVNRKSREEIQSQRCGLHSADCRKREIVASFILGIDNKICFNNVNRNLWYLMAHSSSSISRCFLIIQSRWAAARLLRQRTRALQPLLRFVAFRPFKAQRHSYGKGEPRRLWNSKKKFWIIKDETVVKYSEEEDVGGKYQWDKVADLKESTAELVAFGIQQLQDGRVAEWRKRGDVEGGSNIGKALERERRCLNMERDDRKARAFVSRRGITCPGLSQTTCSTKQPLARAATPCTRSSIIPHVYGNALE